MKTFCYKRIVTDIRYQTLSLLVVLLGMLIMYFYLLSASVVNVVVSREYVQAQREVASAITELEAKFIQMQHSVQHEIALQEGFVAVSKKAFVMPFDSTLVAGHDER